MHVVTMYHVIQYLVTMDALFGTGRRLLLLLHTKTNTLKVGRYGQSPQPINDGAAGVPHTQWTAQALYQTPGCLLSQGNPSCLFGSDQLMASPDGTQVVLVAGVSGRCPCQMYACIVVPYVCVFACSVGVHP